MVGTRVRSSSTSKRPRKQAKSQSVTNDAERLVTRTPVPAARIVAEDLEVTVESARAAYVKARCALENQLKKQAVQEHEKVVNNTRAAIRKIDAAFLAVDYEACSIAAADSSDRIFTIAFAQQPSKLRWYRNTGDGDRDEQVRPFLLPAGTPPTPEERDYVYEYLKFKTWALVRKMHAKLLADGMSVVPLSVIRKELSIV